VTAGSVSTALQRDSLRVEVLPDRVAMGAAAAEHVASRLRELLAQSPDARARILFAGAASQVEFLDSLAVAPGIDWARVDAFGVDEYVGLPAGDPGSVSEWLERHIYTRVHPGRVAKLDPSATDPDAECSRYAALLADGGLDIAAVGIGENGHVAYNEPHVADFEDPLAVKIIDVDEMSRRQQASEGAFPEPDAVPRRAMTVTMSTILGARAISAVVPGPTKAAAIAATLDGPIETACPASALRRHPDAVLFTDPPAMALARP
jgi:glucosamine-6-phosphate deaminase